MCTASWLSSEGRFHLLFNRDEVRSRENGEGPRLHDSEGVRFVAPLDGRAGGAWIAVSERGLVLALLNRSAGVRPDSAGSRGRLIPRLAAAIDRDDLIARLLREPLRDLPPFRLAAFWPHSAIARLATWDGASLAHVDLPPEVGLLCSSGLGDERAATERGEVWERSRAEPGEWTLDRQRRFHRSHAPEASAWSVCMHRDDAETVSYTEVEVAAREVALRYTDGPPCAARPAEELRLNLRAAPSRE
jgi:Transport and Golgi organisation 2